MPAWLAAGLAAIFGGIFRAIWPRIIASVMYLFKTKLGLVITSAMVWLGINFATIKMAIEPAIELLEGYANGGMGGGQLAGIATTWMGMMNFDKAITMIISAIVTKHAVMQGRLYLFKRGFGAKP